MQPFQALPVFLTPRIWPALRIGALMLLVLLSPRTPPAAQATSGSLSPSAPVGHPPDPISDFSWSPPGSFSGVADIQTAFNNARAHENFEIGASVPALVMPSQAEWDAMSEGQKLFWLTNRERIDRGVTPLSGLEANVTSVAQYYAQYLIEQNAFSHNADGLTPWARLETNPNIAACHDPLSVSENLAYFASTANNIQIPVERAVFEWMYNDGLCCKWGHRHTILFYEYSDNSGVNGQEGFMGVGVFRGPYSPPNKSTYPYAVMIVMNVFDPCSTWVYAPSSFSLTGQITLDSGAPIGDVRVSTDKGHSTNSDINGNYTLAGLAPNTYLLTPSRPGYTFSPPSRKVTISTADVGALNFSAALNLKYQMYFPAIFGRLANTIPTPKPGHWENSSTKNQRFYVSTDGASVSNFTVSITIPGCGSYSITQPTKTPITNRQFSFSGPFYASGTFQSTTSASGVYGFKSYYIEGCGYVSSGNRNWNSTWVSTSQPGSNILFEDIAVSDLSIEEFGIH